VRSGGTPSTSTAKVNTTKVASGQVGRPTKARCTTATAASSPAAQWPGALEPDTRLTDDAANGGTASAASATHGRGRVHTSSRPTAPRRPDVALATPVTVPMLDPTKGRSAIAARLMHGPPARRQAGHTAEAHHRNEGGGAVMAIITSRQDGPARREGSGRRTCRICRPRTRPSGVGDRGGWPASAPPGPCFSRPCTSTGPPVGDWGPRRAPARSATEPGFSSTTSRPQPSSSPPPPPRAFSPPAAARAGSRRCSSAPPGGGHSSPWSAAARGWRRTGSW